MRSRLAGLLALLLLTLEATSVRAQTPFYGFNGASFGQGLVAPMDLSAAVSDANPNIPGSQGYVVQLTNGGLWVYHKDNPSTPVATEGEWHFWCSAGGLTGCDPTKTNIPFDTQIAYDAATGRWIVVALSFEGSGVKGAYLYVAASQMHRVNHFCLSRQSFLSVVARLKGPFGPMTSRAAAAIPRFGPPLGRVLLFLKRDCNCPVFSLARVRRCAQRVPCAISVTNALHHHRLHRVN